MSVKVIPAQEVPTDIQGVHFTAHPANFTEKFGIANHGVPCQGSYVPSSNQASFVHTDLSISM